MRRPRTRLVTSTLRSLLVGRLRARCLGSRQGSLSLLSSPAASSARWVAGCLLARPGASSLILGAPTSTATFRAADSTSTGSAMRFASRSSAGLSSSFRLSPCSATTGAQSTKRLRRWPLASSTTPWCRPRALSRARCTTPRSISASPSSPQSGRTFGCTRSSRSWARPSVRSSSSSRSSTRPAAPSAARVALRARSAAPIPPLPTRRRPRRARARRQRETLAL
eukprot:Amastigsp_a4398_83.p3 type:complete len:224 gc:universal Amastigsp_a4398_83:193-864(+)